MRYPSNRHSILQNDVIDKASTRQMARLTYVEVPLPSSFEYALVNATTWSKCRSNIPSRITNDFGVASRIILQL